MEQLEAVVSDTVFRNWEKLQVRRDRLKLRPGISAGLVPEGQRRHPGLLPNASVFRNSVSRPFPREKRAYRLARNAS